MIHELFIAIGFMGIATLQQSLCVGAGGPAPIGLLAVAFMFMVLANQKARHMKHEFPLSKAPRILSLLFILPSLFIVVDDLRRIVNVFIS